MTGRHENPLTVESVVSEYVTRRARELIAEADAGVASGTPVAAYAWIGSAAELLRELTRDE